MGGRTGDPGGLLNSSANHLLLLTVISSSVRGRVEARRVDSAPFLFLRTWPTSSLSVSVSSPVDHTFLGLL